MSPSATAYARFLQRWSVWIVVFFFVALPFVGIGAWKAIKANSNDVKRWLPDAYPETKSLEWYQAMFGMGSDAGVVIVWPESRVRISEPPAQPEAAAKDNGPQIEAHPTLDKLAKLLRDARLDPKDPDSPPLLARVTSGPESLKEMTRRPMPDTSSATPPAR